MEREPSRLPDHPENIYAAESYTERPEQTGFRMHSHVQYEIYCFLEGRAFFTVEGTRYDLAPGDVLLMAPGEVHHVTFIESVPYRRIVVNFKDLSPLPEAFESAYLKPFSDRKFGEFNHYPASLFQSRDFRFYLDALVNKKEEISAFSALLSLLAELSGAFTELREKPLRKSDSEGVRILSYVSKHLTERLSLDGISSRFFISKTQLNRIFKAMTGATVWAYVTTKRLFYARSRMADGKLPTEAAEESGFRDYSTFYRAYRKQFGEMPKKNRKPRRTS